MAKRPDIQGAAASELQTRRKAAVIHAEPTDVIAPELSSAARPVGFMPWGESAEDYASRMADLPERLAMLGSIARR